MKSNRCRRVLLLCNGPSPSKALVRRLARKADVVIAADGGANAAVRNGIRPHVIVGDLDSMLPSTLKKVRNSVIIRLRRQDNTDLEKALDLIAASGRAEVTILGATGGRIDFTIGNLIVFWNYTRTLDISFRGDGWHASPVGRKRVVTAPIGTTISLLPFGPCEGVTLRGLRYPLRNAVMPLGTIGVSNVVQRRQFEVIVRRGNLLLVIFDRVKHR
jgi:thiamine pyrophosphokinase